jgi:crotonobetainyl-CoA:carnitine CoA-transferase CaiB-like acyl-CoA transferase
MAPHGIYPTDAADRWLALGCRDDGDWRALAGLVGEPWAGDARWARLEGRLAEQDELDRRIAAWTAAHERFALAEKLRAVGVPATGVQSPEERVDADPNTASWGLWPEVEHTAMGKVRVDGMPVHFSRTDWEIARGGPCLGEHNERVFKDLLGHDDAELEALRAEGVI